MDLRTKQGRREQGLLIQRAIDGAGLSVDELARRIGCSRALIYQYLSGGTLAQPDRLQEIAAEAGVPLTYFFSATHVPAPHEAGSPPVDDTGARIMRRIRTLEDLARSYASPPAWSALASTCEQLLSLASQVSDHHAEARALLWLGEARMRLGEPARAAEALARACEVLASLDDEERHQEAMLRWGHALHSAGRTAEARRRFEQAAKGRAWEARALGHVALAEVAEQSGQYDVAERECEASAQALPMGPRPEQSQAVELAANRVRALVCLARGDAVGARALAQHCIDASESVADAGAHVESRVLLANACHVLGCWAEARLTAAAAIQLARFVADGGREAHARAVYAGLLATMCDCDECLRQAKDALAGALAGGDRWVEMSAQSALADAYLGTNRLDEARYHTEQASAAAAALRAPCSQADSRIRIARLLYAEGHAEAAAEQARRAVDEAAELGASYIEARARLMVARARLACGDEAAAVEDAQAVLAWAQSAGALPVEWEAEAILARAAIEEASAPPGEALGHSSRAVALIGQAREQLAAAGAPDTLLDDRERLAAFVDHAQLLAAARGPGEARAFVAAARWPALESRLQETMSGGQLVG